DGSDQVIGPHFACFTPAGVLALLGHMGPIVWADNLLGSRGDSGRRRFLSNSQDGCGAADWNTVRIAANLYAMSIFQRQIATGGTVKEPTPLFLMRLVEHGWRCVAT